MDYIWYHKCECGGDYKEADGAVVDTFPGFYPVKCISCQKESSTHLLSQTRQMKWKDPKWTTPTPE